MGALMMTDTPKKPFEWLELIIEKLARETKEKKIINIETVCNLLRSHTDLPEETILELREIMKTPERTGGLAEFNRRLGIKSPSYFMWKKSRRIPESRLGQIIEIAKDVEIIVTRHNLRPDLYDENDFRKY